MTWPSLPPENMAGESFGGPVPYAASGEPVPALLAGQLQPGEQVYWVGRPDPRRVFELADIFTTAFSAVWLSFVVFWMLSALAMQAPPLFVAFGIPFLVVGLYSLLGAPIQRNLTNRRTRYAVTDRRVVVTIGEKKMRIVELSDIRSTSVTVRANGTGSIVFDTGLGQASMPAWAVNYAQGRRTSSMVEMGFFNVTDVGRVQSLVESLRGDAANDLR